MSRWMALLFVLAVTISCRTHAVETTTGSDSRLQAKQESAVRVMSWNIGLNSIFPPDGARAESFSRIVRALDPDVIGLQEFDPAYASELVSLMNESVSLPDGQTWSVHIVSDNALISRHPMNYRSGSRVVPFPLPQLGLPDFSYGFAAALIEMPKTANGDGLLVITMHNKSGASDDYVRLRQVQSDFMIRWLRELRSPDSATQIPDLTPIVVVGDMNVLAGVSTQAYETLVNGDIVDEQTFGGDAAPDWDGTALVDAMPSLNRDGGHYYTWRNDDMEFPPGALDRILYSDSVMSVDQAFVLDTTSLTDNELSGLGLDRKDVLYGGTAGIYDHLPLVMDFRLNETPQH